MAAGPPGWVERDDRLAHEQLSQSVLRRVEP
jgi:hypothetical protein